MVGSSLPSDFSTRPTQVRWLILAVATMSSVLLYLDRICVSFAAESIRLEFAATQAQMGWFLGAFFWSYAIGQVPAGQLSDRFGIRRMLTLYILLWSVFTALLGLSTGIVSLLGYRLGCGLAQAGAYPSCARAVRDWMPTTQRGVASSIVAFGGRVGGAIAPVLTGAIMLGLAMRGQDPQFTGQEIVAPSAIQKILVPTDDAPAGWVNRVLQSASSVNGQTLGNDAVTPRTMVPDFQADNARQKIADWLNGMDPVKSLSAVASLDDLQLPPALVLKLKSSSQTETTDEERQLANRQFWEAALPGGVRKLEGRGWRQTLVIYGVAGIVVAGLFWLLFRNTPQEHPWCNAEEAQWIGQTTVAVKQNARFPWAAILTSPNLWGNSMCQATTNMGWIFLVTWLPRYLDEVHRVPVLERSVMASIPIFAGLAGMLAGGPWTDRLTKKYGLAWGRRIPVASSRLLAVVGYGLCILVTLGWVGALGTRFPAWVAIAGLSIVAISTDLGVAATWAFAQDIAGRHTAAVIGWANMWGNLGAAVAPPILAEILGEAATIANWNYLFLFCMGSFLLATLGGAMMDSSQPLEPATP